MTVEEFRSWYETHRPLYEAMQKDICRILDALLKENKIDHLSVTGRAKDIESAVKKAKDKEYVDPSKDIHDFCGVRVITYVETDVARVAELVDGTFNIHKDKSVDKRTELGINKIGYRSLHYVCDIGEERAAMPECKKFKGLVFEIQIRTILQHAWAEIEHDRNYKFSEGVLPGDIQRRLFLVSGVLELADRELANLADEIDEYSSEVKERATKGDLDVDINSVSVRQYLMAKIKDFPDLEAIFRDDPETQAELIDEMHSFGLIKLSDLDQLFNQPGFVDAIRKYRSTRRTDVGLIRDVMMWADIDRYFAHSWKEHWGAWGDMTPSFLINKYGMDKVRGISKEYRIKGFSNI